MSIKKIGIVSGVLFALVVAVTPVIAACDLSHPEECTNEQLTALIQGLSGTGTGTGTTGSISGIPAGFQFNTNLKQTSTGNDVKYLQILLNSDAATKVATTGAGSPGNETTYFGPATKAAVIKFQQKYASEVLAPYGLTAGTGYFGVSSRTKANAILAGGGPVTTCPTEAVACVTGGYNWVNGACSCQSTCPTTAVPCVTAGYNWVNGVCSCSGTTPPVVGGFSAALATTNPASGTLVQGQSRANLLEVLLTNGTSSEVKVTSLELTRLGVSADTTLANVYLYDGTTRLTDAGAISSGKVTFNNPNGVIVIPANSAKTISVKSDISNTSSGQTVGVSVSGITSSTTLSGTVLPIAGNTHTIAAATLATVAVGTVTPSAPATVNAGVQNYTVFSAPLTIGTRAVNLEGITLKMIGSITTDALENLQLYVNGVATGSPITLTSDGIAKFALSTPVAMQSGAGTIEVRANIVKGSSRSFSFSLENAADLALSDSVYNVNVTGTGIPKATQTVSISAGSVSVTVDATFSPSGLTSGVSNTTLAKYNFKAYGEDVKVTYLDVTPSLNIDNVIIYANGSPITSSQNYTGTKLSFSVGSSLIIPANTTVSVEVRGDTKAASVAMTNGTNVTITLNTRANNAQGVSSSTLSSAPASDITAPTLQVGTGTLDLAVSSSFPATGNITPNTNNQKIGSYVVQSGSADGVRINNISVALGGTLPVTSLSNLYVKYGSDQSAYIVSPQASNNFSTSIQLQPSTPLTIDVYANIGSLGTVVNADDTQKFTASKAQVATNGVAASSSSVYTYGGAGTASITVNGLLVTAVEVTDTATTVTNIVNALNSNPTITSGWTVTSSGGTTVILTRKTAGAAGNFPVVTSATGAGSTFVTAVSPTVNGTNNVPQISTLTPENVEVGDVFTAGVGSTSISFTATVATRANVAAGIVAAWNDNPTLAAIATATVTGGGGSEVVTLTAVVSGTTGAFIATSSAANGYHSALGSTVQVTLGMSATGISSNTTVVPTPAATLAGQTMTVAGISLATPTLMSSSPVQQFVLAGSTGSYLANYNFVSTNGISTITELRFKTTNSGITSITVGGKTVPVVSNAATVTELSIPIGVGYSGVTVPVQVNYNTVGINGVITSNTDTKLTLTYVKYTAGTTTTVMAGPPAVDSNTMYVVGGIPSITMTQGSTKLDVGPKVLGTIQVSVASGDSIKVEQLPINVTLGGTAALNGNFSIELTDGGTSIAIGAVAAGAGQKVLVLDTPYTISSGQTVKFNIIANVATAADGDSVSTTLGSKGSFEWTDVLGNVSNLTGTNIPTYTETTSSSMSK